MKVPKNFVFLHRGLTLRASFYQVPAPIDYVVLNHGFSSNRYGTGRLLVQIARALHDEGYAVLAFDRLGHGESDGEFSEITASDEVRQLETVLDTMKQRVGRPMHVVGHSLGGMGAAVLAGERPDLVKSLNLWAPAASFVEDTNAGHIMGDPLPENPEEELFDFDGQGVGAPFINDARAFDPYRGLGNYDGPVNLHHAEDDPIVPIRASERYLSLWGEQARLHRYSIGGHGWTQLGARKRLIQQTVADIEACSDMSDTGLRAAS